MDKVGYIIVQCAQGVTMLDLNTLLEDSRFSYLKRITDEKTFNKIVQVVDSTETPDVQFYLKPYSILLTTGMVFQDNQEGLITMIDELNDVNCSGLFIKLGRYVKELDQSVVDYANLLDFPIVQIPLDKTLGEVYNELLTYVWDNKNEQLTYAFNIQKQLHELLLQNSNPQDILNSLGKMFNVDIALIDPFEEVSATSLETLLKFEEQELIQLIKKEKPTYAMADLIKDKNGVSHHCVVELVQLNMTYPYYLIIVDPTQLVYPASSFAIDQVIIILSFILYRDLNLDYQLMANREQYLSQNIQDRETLVKVGEEFGVRMSRHYQCITLQLLSKVSKKINLEAMEWFTLIYNWLKKQISDIPKIILFPDRSLHSYTFLLQDVAFSEVIDRFVMIHHRVKENFSIDSQIGVGLQIDDILDLEKSKRASQNALKSKNIDKNYPMIQHFESYDFKSLFNEIPLDHRLDFCQSVLKDLYDLNDENKVELMKTLKVFLDNNSDYAMTARQLYVHRNTVRYRVNKCKDILNSDLLDSRQLFEVHIALNLIEKSL